MEFQPKCFRHLPSRSIPKRKISIPYRFLSVLSMSVLVIILTNNSAVFISLWSGLWRRVVSKMGSNMRRYIQSPCWGVQRTSKYNSINRYLIVTIINLAFDRDKVNEQRNAWCKVKHKKRRVSKRMSHVWSMCTLVFCGLVNTQAVPVLPIKTDC